MPIDQAEKDWVIRKAGYDPSRFDLDENSLQIIPKSSNQSPANSTVTSLSPKAGNDISTMPSVGPTGGAIAAAGISAGRSVIPTAAAGLTVAGISAAMGAGGLGLSSTGVGAIAGIPLMIGGGVLASLGARKYIQKPLEEAALSPETIDYMNRTQAEHPVASVAGGIATMPLGGMGSLTPGGMLANLKNVGFAAAAVPKIATGAGATANELLALRNVGAGMGIGAGSGALSSIVEKKFGGEGGQITPQGLLMDALLGAAFNKPNVIGRKLGFHDIPKVADEVTPEMLANLQQQQARGIDVTPAVPEKPFKVGEITTTPTQDILNSVFQGKSGKPTKTAKDSFAAMQEAWQAKADELLQQKAEAEKAGDVEGQKNADEALAELAKEKELVSKKKEDFFKANQELEDAKNRQLRMALGEPGTPEEMMGRGVSGQEQQKWKINRKPFGKANEEVADESAADLELRRKYEGLGDKYSEQSNLGKTQTELGKQTEEALAAKGKSGALTPKLFEFFQSLGLKRGVLLKLKEQVKSGEGDREIAGKVSPTTREGEISLEKAAADTMPHEIGHPFLRDMKNSPRGRDRVVSAKYNKLTESLPEYQSWKKAREEAGLDSSVEEFQANNVGTEAINRAIREEGPFKKYWNDLSSYVKTRYGKHGTYEDAQRVINYKLLHDPAYSKVFGKSSIGEVANRGVVNASEQSNLGEEGKPVKAQFAHEWPSPEDAAKYGVTPKKFYHLLEDIEGHPKGSTITEDSIRKKGYYPSEDAVNSEQSNLEGVSNPFHASKFDDIDKVFNYSAKRNKLFVKMMGELDAKDRELTDKVNSVPYVKASAERADELADALYEQAVKNSGGDMFYRNNATYPEFYERSSIRCFWKKGNEI